MHVNPILSPFTRTVRRGDGALRPVQVNPVLSPFTTIVQEEVAPAPTPAEEPAGTALWSIASEGSIASMGSAGSIASIGSVGSILSIGSAGSILSIGSAGSVLSIGSVGSVASIGSGFSVGALGGWGEHRTRVVEVGATLLAVAALATATLRP